MLIVARREYFPLLYLEKEKNPKLNFKLIDKNGLLDLLSYSFRKDAIPLLIQKGISYSRAKKFLNILRIRIPSKDAFLDGLEKELEDGGYLYRDPLGRAEIDSLDVRTFRLDSDDELLGYLNRNGVLYSSADEIVDWDSAKDLTKMPKVYLFPDKFSQYMYAFSDIRRRIKENPDIKDRIAIHVKDDSDFLYIKLLSRTFGLPYYRDDRRKLLSFPLVKKELEKIFAAKTFENVSGGDAPELLELGRLIEHFGLSSLEFDFAYANLLEILASTSIKEEGEKKGIPVVTDFAIVPNRLTYILDFQYGDFYREFDDKNVYPDSRIVEIGANPSYALTSMDRDLKADYLSFTEFPFLSRVNGHLNDSLYDSQFFHEFKWDKKRIERIEDNPDGLYSSASALLYQADWLDRKHIHAPIGKLNCYDHSFKGIGRSLYEKNKVWSVTNLEQYILCPFRYLMGVMLPEQEDSDFFLRAFGTAAHKLYEKAYRSDFDFEASFDEAKASFLEYLQKVNAPLTGRDKALLELSKYWLSYTVPIIGRWKEVAKILPHDDDAEIQVRFALSDKDGNAYRFSGRIDKLVWTKGDEGTYCTIIDYKTGGETFEPHEVFLGRSTQLPIYYWALQQSENIDVLEKAKLAGFGIQHISFKTPKDAFVNKGIFSEENLKKNARIGGVLLKEPDYVSSFDNTAFKKDSTEINSRGGEYADFKWTYLDPAADSLLKMDERPYTLKDLLEDAKSSLVETIQKIESGDFAIAPTSFHPATSSDRPVCSYCAYRDVCYRVLAKDQKDYTEIARKHFALEEEEEL